MACLVSSGADPYLCDVFRKRGDAMYVSDTFGMILRLDEDGAWIIEQDFLTLARAHSDGLHPNTIYAGEWYIQTYLFEWERSETFRLSLSEVTSHYAYSLDEIGVDFFGRIQQTRPIHWIADDGQVYWSGAKNGGKRWCHVCSRVYSANNMTQHFNTTFHQERLCKPVDV